MGSHERFSIDKDEWPVYKLFPKGGGDPIDGPKKAGVHSQAAAMGDKNSDVFCTRNAASNHMCHHLVVMIYVPVTVPMLAPTLNCD